MKRRLTAAIVAVFGLAIVGIGTILVPSTSATGRQAFTDKTINGTWGFSASGTIVPPALPSSTPAAAVGIIEFDGHGGCTFVDQINIGGTSIPSTGFRTSAFCSYGVNSDGTGTISVSFPSDPAPTPLTFVIIDNAKEIQFIRTDAGVATGVAKRQ